MTLALALFAAGFSVLQRGQVWPRQLAFNTGRITTYAAAGAAAGALGGAGAYVAAVLPAQVLLYLLPQAFAAGGWGVAAGVQQTILCL